MEKALLLFLVLALAWPAAAQQPAGGREVTGDPVRGAKLHRGCFDCHGVERYTAALAYRWASFIDSVLRASGLSDTPPAPPKRFKGRITSLSALREAVIRRNDYLDPKMTPQEVEDVVAYLNVTYYKFPRP